ncbi:MAG TPA: pilus assembly PilX N-terminal domain-containing protein [Candidatus Eisenbacteria bacterium]|nr:pilus assembly PilX N-terminal domain-containing protein [Candidatus Eisenbacteria bacterium]
MNRNRERWEMSDGPEAGNTLVVALLILFLLTAVGISYVAVTKGEKQIAGNQLSASQAFQSAEAGISEILVRMSNPNQGYPSYLAQDPGTYTPGWGWYVVNDPGAGSLDPQYDATLTDGRDNDGDAAVDESSEHYRERGSLNSSGSIPLNERLDYPWVKVRYKLDSGGNIVLFGDHDNNPTTPPVENTTRGIPKIIVTAQGRRGVGSKIVTVEAVKWPLPPVPGSVYTEGPITFNGNAFFIDGHDHEPTAPYDTVASSTPLLGISTPNDPSIISDAIIGQQADNVDGSGGSPSVGSSNVNLDLPALAAAWSQLADITLSGPLNNPSTAGWGSIGDLKIVHVAGDLHISGNASGAGVLVVDGNFDLTGTFNWNGVVLILGDVTVAGGGTAKQVVGAMMVQGTLSGASSMNGAIKLLYSSAMISQLNALTPYEVSSWIDQ